YGTAFGKLGSDVPGKRCSKSCGNVFGFTQGGDQQILGYSFDAGDNDGAFPTGEPALVGGLLFGTTEYGPGTDCGGLGCGTIFEIGVSDGHEKRVVPFCRKPNCADGAFPKGGVTVNQSTGYVFGTTTFGGKGNGFLCDSAFGGCGTVYRLSPTGTNPIVIHSFCAQTGCPDGSVPGASPLFYKGKLYGTTQFGGSSASGGTIFRLATNGNDYKVLYQFCSLANCADGAVPQAALIADAA